MSQELGHYPVRVRGSCGQTGLRWSNLTNPSLTNINNFLLDTGNLSEQITHQSSWLY